MDRGRRHVLFLGEPAAEDIHPVLGVVEELLSRGIRISYATGERFAGLVRASGADALDVHTALSESAPHLVVYQSGAAEAARNLARHWDVPVVAMHTGIAPKDDAREAEEPAVVFVPRAFQPDQEHFGDEFAFVGPSVSGRFYTEARWRPPTSEPVLVVRPDGRDEVLAWCADAFADQPWHVVADTEDGSGLPANFEVLRDIPALAVLRHAAVLLCGGSPASVLSAAHQGVPVVVVAGTADQRTVAEQVTRLGLGRVIHTARELPEAVLGVAEDGAAIADARRLQRLVLGAGGTEGAADVIQACLLCD
ncbi:nucleotide disphospho-sugar-binding domain-containing protein [Allokutzneria oryzae]|uniref:Nucleotide disphospho-sugar-binding domain-containing protein n=1 Tax=Allokutzneria oryzae TaxID=1378989 RepID=A0ABV5ZWR2_9PSEU